MIGAGYVGLTTAACFAHLGFDVVCGDIDTEKLERIAKGEVSLLEDGLADLVIEGLDARRLRFVTGASAAVDGAEFVFVCVPTPLGADGAADLTHVEAVAREIAPRLGPEAIVINKSTMPVGSTTWVTRVLTDAGARHEVGVAANPEFLREGNAVRDFLKPTRVVIGADDPAIAVRVSHLYRDVQAPIVVTDAASAEMIKYASNAFLATKISFVNAIANLCEAMNADIRDVTLGMGYDPRIGVEFLHAGPGWGGSCFPKDTLALLHTAEQVGYDFTLLRGAVSVNVNQRVRIVDKIREACGGDLAGARVAVWGLTFKADTDDLRDSPALEIIALLKNEGAAVCAFDPAVHTPVTGTDGIELVSDPYQACAGADALALLTEWDEFRWLDFSRVASALRRPSLVDARNLLDPAAIRHLGFTYLGVGR